LGPGGGGARVARKGKKRLEKTNAGKKIGTILGQESEGTISSAKVH